ncbi:MAG: undecaprenyl/decaprenyl-phosphate alpha-N-acetylglucosaminyl 1-phosphate transferase [Deltaproteobacteria bacterium]|nr:undecaprenyl/decaprenyl-phosphate alpha-N-acetylglucosaminyl 1-phosphate transferase [Deltaproteobacteria bacterium]
MNYLVVFLLAFIITILLTPFVKLFAIKFSFYDYHNDRKIHQTPKPKLGGCAIFVGFVLSTLCIISLNISIFKSILPLFIPLMICGGIILCLGIYDDIEGSGAFIKLSIQIIAASIFYNFGFQFSHFSIPSFINIPMDNLSFPLTLLWLVGITNAFNLIDGIDGLASSLAIIASICLFVLGLYFNDTFLILMSLALIGSNLAFLKYNLYPSKIFMGDAGSLFLGFTLGSLALYSPRASSDKNPLFFFVALTLFIPLLDAFYAIIRRILKKKNIFQGDKEHIHHILLKKGFSQSQVTLTLSCFSSLIMALSLILILFVIK